MKILFITKLLPYPLDAGGKLKTYKILKLLSLKHEIYLVSLVDNEDDQRYEIEIKKICKSIKTSVFSIVNQNHKIQLLLKLFVSILSLKPFTVYKYYSSEMNNYIRDFLKNNSIDFIYIDHLTMTQYIPSDYKGKLICDEHNISYIAFRSYLKNEKNPFLWFIYLLESIKMLFFEKKYLPKFDHIFSISEIDRRRIINIGVNPKKVAFLPIPFDNPYILNHSFKDNPILVFVGLLSWLPNESAIYWFIEEVLPIIRKNIPSISFIIAGKYGERIDSYLKRLNDHHIKYVGYVKDLKPFYKKADVFVAPILMGGGVRIKILEGMSYGLPVVSTTLGAEGLDVKNRNELLIGDTPEEFADAIIEVITNKNLALKLSQNAYKFIKRNYNEAKSEKALSVIDTL